MNIFKFTDFDSFYKNYNPLTPYGKNDKSNKEIYTSEELLNNEYKFIDNFICLLLGDSDEVASIEYYLKRIPKLDFLDNSYYTASEIFQIKKFLFNYKQISDKLSSDHEKLCFLKFKLINLFGKLDLNKGKETFFLSEKYSDGLKRVRFKIKRIDKKLSVMKKERLEFIKNEFNLDFRFQDFIVIEEAKVLGINEKYVFKESYDSTNVIVKPVFQKEYFELHTEKESLVKTEREEEKEVIIQLSSEIKKELDEIKKYIKSIHKFDVILAKAVLARRFSMVKPTIAACGENIKIQKGVCIPVKENCFRLGTEYYPLDVAFNNRMIVVSGSNMGGKTVVLKTVAFLQLLTQMGFYVPAEKYKTVVFEKLNYIGDLSHKHSAGLSSYGIEIYELIKCVKTNEEKTLFFIDEFAGTTNSFEAEALISAILSRFSEQGNVYSFLSTHFMNLPEFENLSFYRMKGLDSDKYEKYYRAKSEYDFIERIKLINTFMRYELVHDVDRVKSFDALKIAEILGLDKSIIAKAKCFVNKS